MDEVRKTIFENPPSWEDIEANRWENVEPGDTITTLFNTGPDTFESPSFKKGVVLSKSKDGVLVKWKKVCKSWGKEDVDTEMTDIYNYLWEEPQIAELSCKKPRREVTMLVVKGTQLHEFDLNGRHIPPAPWGEQFEYQDYAKECSPEDYQTCLESYEDALNYDGYLGIIKRGGLKEVISEISSLSSREIEKIPSSFKPISSEEMDEICKEWVRRR